MYANMAGSGSPDAWVETLIVDALNFRYILNRGTKVHTLLPELVYTFDPK